jgi:hypothetical protein
MGACHQGRRRLRGLTQSPHPINLVSANTMPVAAAHQCRSWHIASIRGNAALRSLSERSGHCLSRGCVTHGSASPCPLRPRVAPPWSTVTSRPVSMGPTRGPKGREGPLRCGWAALSAHESQTTRRPFNNFLKTGAMGSRLKSNGEMGPATGKSARSGGLSPPLRTSP